MKQIAVIGAGTMGNGIALVCAVSGFNVTIVDISDDALNSGLSALSSGLDRMVQKGKLQVAEQGQAIARVTGSTDYTTISGADLVIEAATENLELKLRILRQIDSLVGEQTIVATNTSSISITQLAVVMTHPGRFVGAHFFNPVPVMSLVELIRGLQTTDDTHRRVLDFVRRIGKNPITVRNHPGFVVNRILVPMINEAIFVLQENLATAEDIDAGMRLGCNQPIGPLALADLIGLDTLLAVMQVFYEGFNDSKYRPAPLLKEMVSAGRLGRKSGLGFFSYA